MTEPFGNPPRDDGGFALVALIAFLTVLSLLAAVAVPMYTTQARRELEEELIFRGEEYVRAIQKYQREFGVYPPDIDALLESNQMRFLRREYVDPITGEPFRLIKANPDGTLEGSRIYQFDDLPLFAGPLGSGGPDSRGPDAGGEAGASQMTLQRSSSPGFGTSNGGLGANSENGLSGNFAQPGAAGATVFQAGGGLPGFSQPGGNFRGPQTAPGGGGLGQAPSFPGPQGTGPGVSAFPQTQGGSGAPASPDGSGPRGRPGAVDVAGSPDGSTQRGTPAGPTNPGFGGTLAGALMGVAQATGSNASGFGGAGVAGHTIAISGIVGVAPDNEQSSINVYNGHDIYAEWEFTALPSTPGGIPTSGGGVGEGQNNTGQPAGAPAANSPFGGSLNSFPR